jgi:hypothetical protein
LSYEVSNYFAHVTLYFRTYVTLQYTLSSNCLL